MSNSPNILPFTPSLRRCVVCREVIVPTCWEDTFSNICEPCFIEQLDPMSGKRDGDAA
jgi:hypothetical protein